MTTTQTQTSFLVTGVSGQLGMEMLRQYSEIILPRTRAMCDKLDFNQFADLLASVKPTAVLHSASFPGFDCTMDAAEVREKLWHSNVLTTDNLAKACARTGTPLLFVSCDQVFGGRATSRSVPYQEAATAIPSSHYGMTKIAAEHAIFRLAHSLPTKYWAYGFKFWIVRVPFLLDRPWAGCTNAIVDSLLLSRRRGEPAYLPADVVFSPIYLPDLAAELFWLLNTRNLASGLYHLGGQNAVTMAVAGEAVSQFCGHKAKITVLPELARCCETRHGFVFRHLSKYTALDSSKYQALSGRKLPTAQQTLARLAADIDAYPL